MATGQHPPVENTDNQHAIRRLPVEYRVAPVLEPPVARPHAVDWSTEFGKPSQRLEGLVEPCHVPFGLFHPQRCAEFPHDALNVPVGFYGKSVSAHSCPPSDLAFSPASISGAWRGLTPLSSPLTKAAISASRSPVCAWSRRIRSRT